MTSSQNASTLLLCTDMDRTVIPNGAQPEHPRTRSAFRLFANNQASHWCTSPGDISH